MNKLILSLLLLITVMQAKDVTLVLPWKHQFQFVGYYMAKELGLYEKAGLNVDIKEYDLKRDNAKDVSSIKYEFGVGHSSVILDRLNKYQNIRILNAVHQSSPFVLLSLKRPDITSLKDVAGKKVMMSRYQVTTASINAMLSSEHLEIDSYKVIDTSFNPQDLINRNADFMTSYISNEPFILSEKGLKYTIFDPKDYNYNFYSDMLFTSTHMIKNNPDVVKAFYNASMLGWKYAYEHIDESVELILKHYNTQSRTKKALFFEANALKKLAFKDGVNFGNVSNVRLKEIINTYRLLGLVNKNEKNIDFNSFTYKIKNDSKLTINTKEEDNYSMLETEYLKKLFILLSLIAVIAYLFKKRTDNIIAIKTKQLEKQNEIFDQNISSSKTDLNGKITYVSKAFCKASGYKADELLGKTHKLLKDKNTPDSIYKDLWLTISSGHTWRGELKNIGKNKKEYWVDAVISPILDKNGTIVEYEAIRQDITLKKILKEFNFKLEEEVKQRTAELEKLAITDKLTGIYNRLKLDKELSYSYESYLRYNLVYSVIIIDVDYFKKINDTYGHLIGDDILKELSSIMQENIRSTDILGRWGGEEFIILSPSTDIEGTYKLAENIRLNVENTIFKDGIKMTISAGIAEISQDMNKDEIIKKADEALYRAKSNGRNKVEK